ncbi:hypothetical protein Aca07nite_08850 [Actinoplanes capillaceus]|uniref:Fibronectin type-III domain-containing protein n=1 Tax=Actinoplanes campanulatus TaxID=113559 RepID=A0ABQ3WDD8_9ACTN|nr:hypothetical protein [Actinoplanes capillaceus]GID43610.1 hypothetical protein Aca07nite_08850 [Actinoplanes capillaceus]
MRRRSAAAIVAAVAVGAIAVGSGLSAWATWTVGTASGQATVQGDSLPGVNKPVAELAGGVVRVSWEAVEFGSGQAVGGYVVFRHDGGDRLAVCRGPATKLTCTDDNAEVGRAVTYTVAAIAGDHWTGPASPISDLVIRPGGPGAASLAAGSPTSAATSETGRAEEDETGRTEAGKTVEPTASPSGTAPSSSASPSAAASPSPSTPGKAGSGGANSPAANPGKAGSGGAKPQ